MLIQCFAQNTNNAVAATAMIHNYYKDKIKIFEVSLTKDINDGPYLVEPIDSLEKAWAKIEELNNDEFDNIGIYYNEGQKIFVKIYKNAKNDFEAFKHSEEPDTLEAVEDPEDEV